MIKLGEYEHYSGRHYEVIGIAKHSETLADMVVYQSLYKPEKEFEGFMWVRPMKMFLGNARVNGKLVQRFRKISDVIPSTAEGSR